MNLPSGSKPRTSVAAVAARWAPPFRERSVPRVSLANADAVSALAPRAASSPIVGDATLIACGVLVAGAGLAVDPARGWAGLLVAALFGISLALGGAIFIALCGVVRARWWLPIRALPLALARTLAVPLLALAVVFIFGLGSLYPWADPAKVAASHLLQLKAVWLDRPFFLARALVAAMIWLGLIGALGSRLRSLGDADSLVRLRKTSAIFLVLLAPTLSIASWDWTMSLEPEWFSTMWTVYSFSGWFLGAIAVVSLVAVQLHRRGVLDLSPTVTHDLGKLLFAFSSFWAYIWFCQAMLIWYANIPEEASWFARRLEGGWSIPFFVVPLLEWAVPFVFLLSARMKASPFVLAQMAVVVLVGHWLDVWVMVEPALGPLRGLPLFALGATLAVGAGMHWRLKALLPR